MKNRIIILILLCISSNVYSQNRDWSFRPKNELNDSIVTLSNKVDSLTIVTDSLRKVIDDLSVLRNWMENHLIENYNDYHAKSFSEFDTCLVDSLISVGKSVQSTKLDAWIQRLCDTKAYQIKYNTYSRLIETEFDSIIIDSAQHQINNIISLCSEIQRNEFNELSENLQLYHIAIEKLYRIAYDITYRVERYRKENDDFRTKRTAEDLFKRFATDYSQYISKIPYTDSLYIDFKKSILEKPLEISEYEKKILSFESLITNN